MPFKVAFLGFSDFERGALASYFRLAHDRTPCYEQVATLTDADYLVADADHGPSVQLVLATERQAETVFIGAQAPAGCPAWMSRPIDALHVMRELDAMVQLGSARPPAPLAAPDISLPEAPPPPPRRPRPAAPPAVLARPLAPPATPRALLVDDSEIALRFLESRLSRWKLDIDRAASSGRALECLANQSYDFVFLDVELGEDSELDGLALCQHIKHQASSVNTAVVLVSAHHSELDRVRGALAGCDAYLGKPLDEVELQRLLLRQGLKALKDEGAPQS